MYRVDKIIPYLYLDLFSNSKNLAPKRFTQISLEVDEPVKYDSGFITGKIEPRVTIHCVDDETGEQVILDNNTSIRNFFEHNKVLGVAKYDKYYIYEVNKYALYLYKYLILESKSKKYNNSAFISIPEYVYNLPYSALNDLLTCGDGSYLNIIDNDRLKIWNALEQVTYIYKISNVKKFNSLITKYKALMG